MTVAEGLDSATAILDLIRTSYGKHFEVLAGLNLLQLERGDFVRGRLLGQRTGNPTLDSVLSRLAQLGKEPVWFGFSSSGKRGKPVLIFASNKAELTAQKGYLEGKGHLFRGQVVMNPKGWVEFHTKNDIAKFLPYLAMWVGHYKKKHKSLKKLDKSRAIQTDSRGNVVARKKNDSLWK